MMNIYLLKGFPENDESIGDIYDHDETLDILGGNLNVPRKNYVSVSENLLYKTEPPFNRQLTEDDYNYQESILKYVNDFEKSFLPVLDIWKFYSFETIAQNRHHLLTRQNIDVMRDDEDENNVKYMKTKTDYHSSVYDIFGDYDDLPSNIKLPKGDEVVDLIQKSLPLSRKAFFNLSAKKIIPYNTSKIVDIFKMDIHFKTEKDKILDFYNTDIDTENAFNDNLSIKEYSNINTELCENNSIIQDYLNAFVDHPEEEIFPSSFKVDDSLYIDTSTSEKGTVKINLQDNELPNTIANADSLKVTRDMGVKSGINTYWNPSSYVSIVTDGGEKAYKCLSPVTMGSEWSWFDENAQNYYTSSKCITNYLYVPYAVTISFDIKIPSGINLVFATFTYNTSKASEQFISQNIEGTGSYQRIKINIPTSSTRPFMYWSFIAEGSIGVNNPFYIKKYCVSKNNNGKYIKSKLVDTGWLNSTKVKGDITSWTNYSSTSLNVDASRGYMTGWSVASNSHSDYTYAGGFYSTSTIHSDAIIKKSFASWATKGMHNSGSAGNFAESALGTVTNYFGPCQYGSTTGISYIPTHAIKNRSSSAYNVSVMPYYVNSTEINDANSYIKSNPADFSMRMRLRNNSTNSLFLGFEFVTVRTWYEPGSITLDGEATTPPLNLGTGINRISKIAANDTIHTTDDIIYSILDDNDNVLFSNITFPFFTDHLNIDIIKILSKLVTHDKLITPIQEGYILHTLKKYNLITR